MEITWKRDEGKLTYGSKTIDVVCDVRNEINGRRLLTERAVFSEKQDGSDGVPYMPRKFPLGRWRILGITPKTIDYEAPEFMSTDAHQVVEEWSLKPDGSYKEKTEETVLDWGYGFHNSSSSTTLGCGRILGTLDGETKWSTIERREFFEAVRLALGAGDSVWIVVS